MNFKLFREYFSSSIASLHCPVPVCEGQSTVLENAPDFVWLVEVCCAAVTLGLPGEYRAVFATVLSVEEQVAGCSY